MADIERLIRSAAAKWHVDPKILRAQLVQESGLNNNAVSPKGARGIGQFIPGTAKAYGVKPGGDPKDDIYGAAHYMADNLKMFGGDYRKALAAYNAGAGAVQRFGGIPPYAETQNYVKTIMANAGGAPKAGGGGSSQGSSTQGASATPTVETTPGQSFQPDRAAAAIAWLQARKRGGGAQALMNLAQVPADIPAQTSLSATQVPSKAMPASSGAAGSSKGMSRLLELFWQGQGGIDVKNGKKVPQGFVSGHQDHVHVAAGPKTTVALGQLAEKLGLHVGENPKFGGVNPVHVPNSYHYKGEAIDVSGDPKLMQHFAALVAHKYGLKVNG